jgi:hypothetical protein
MAGILDGKKRILDTVLTAEGRRQLAAQTFRISFASFSDGGTFYQGDVESGSSDAGKRVFFEVSPRGRDQITFETDDSGRLVPYVSTGDSLQIVDGKVVSASVIIPNGDRFASLASGLVTSSIDNFQNLRLLGTEDIFLDTGKFELNRNDAVFTITDRAPLSMTEDVTETSVDNVESFFQDKRLSHIPNFKYLPPVNKGTTNPIGLFHCRGQGEILTFEQLQSELEGREQVEITFPSTSRENNLVSQFFELSAGSLKKLDVIDYGEFVTDDPDNPIKQVFFVGKIFIDSFGNGTFVNLFVMVFE